MKPSTLDNQHYKLMFKESFMYQLNDLIGIEYYNGNVYKVSRIGYDVPNFLLKDPSKYTNYDFSQDGCSGEGVE